MHVQTMGMKDRSGEQIHNYKKKTQQKYSYFYSPPIFKGGRQEDNFWDVINFISIWIIKQKKTIVSNLKKEIMGGGPPLL